MLIVAERFPDLDDALHQAVIGDRDVPPHRLHQLVLGEDLSRSDQHP
jgi:hypothetical protein